MNKNNLEWTPQTTKSYAKLFVMSIVKETGSAVIMEPWADPGFPERGRGSYV